VTSVKAQMDTSTAKTFKSRIVFMVVPCSS